MFKYDVKNVVAYIGKEIVRTIHLPSPSNHFVYKNVFKVNYQIMEALAKTGIYFDEVDKIRVLEPEVAKQTNDLKDECQIYVEKIDEFQKITDSFVDLTEKLSKEVEKQKIKAIGARNILQSMSKEKEVQVQQLQALITEKSMELERLKVQMTSLQKTEMEQVEVINRLTHAQ